MSCSINANITINESKITATIITECKVIQAVISPINESISATISENLIVVVPESIVDRIEALENEPHILFFNLAELP